MRNLHKLALIIFCLQVTFAWAVAPVGTNLLTDAGKIQGKKVTKPTAADDGKVPTYIHASSSLKWRTGATGGGTWGTITGTLSSQTDLQTALGLKENTANKDTDGTLAANSDTKYPSQKAVKTYVDANAGTPLTTSTGYPSTSDITAATPAYVSTAIQARYSSGFTIESQDPNDFGKIPKYDSSGALTESVAFPTCTGTDKLTSDGTNMSCAADQTGAGGSGITTLNTLNATTQSFAKVNDTNVTLNIGSATSTHTFTLGWTGTLADARITNAATWNAKQAALVSGTNIKSVNGISLLGSGDLVIGGSMTWPSVAGIPYWTSGTAWGGAYSASNKIPANYITDPLNQNTSGTAAGLSATLAVGSGGTGRTTSTTAYGLIAAGTTATGVQQTLPAGATTEILVGGGASSLPVWTTATGSGAPVRATSPVLTTPNLGTPSALVLTSATGGVPGNFATGNAMRRDAIEYVIDGGGSAITTGIKGDLELPYAATVIRATTLCDQSGSIVIDVWKDTYANFPPTVADTITASAKPTVSSAVKGQVTTLTGWTTSLSAGDILRFNVDSATTVTRCTVSLVVEK
jgi:hypothetical protein